LRRAYDAIKRDQRERMHVATAQAAQMLVDDVQRGHRPLW
jgi:hypothetical protein